MNIRELIKFKIFEDNLDSLTIATLPKFNHIQIHQHKILEFQGEL